MKFRGVKPNPSPFHKAYEFQLGPRTTLLRGDPVKVKGIRGKFTFLSRQWCFSMVNDEIMLEQPGWVNVKEKSTGGIRSFTPDRIKKGKL
jgi:hypothetical protein